jgi:hypothetical protein
MRRAVVVVSIQLVLASACGAAADTEIVLQAGFAGYDGATDVSVSVDGGIAHHNLGAMPSLDIWHQGGVAFLRFDVSKLPRAAKVKKATLEIFVVSCGFSIEQIARQWPIRVYECKYRWSEGTGLATDDKHDGATLGTRDGTFPWVNGKPVSCAGAVLGSAVIGSAAHEWVRWGLKTYAVEQWISHPEENFGVVVWGKPPGKAVSFASRESGSVSQRPILRLTLSVPDANVAAVKRNPQTQTTGDGLAKGRDADKGGTSLEVKLAIEHAGPQGASDAKTVARFRAAIDRIQKSCSREKPSREDIGRVLLATRRTGRKEGIEINLLEFTEGLEFMLRDLDGQIRVSDAAGSMLLFMIGESKPESDDT